MISLPHLETDVTQACQLSCVGCNHAVPLWRRHGPWTNTPEGVARDLKALANVAHASTWAALGGEPLLNLRITEIIYQARLSGIADHYEVWTNGMRLLNMKDDFWLALRGGGGIVISRYPGKLTDQELEDIRWRCEHERIVLTVRDEINSPNFMTWLEPTPTDGPTTQRKYTHCAFRRGSNYCASYGYFFACCCGPHIPMLVQGRSFGDDGLALEGITEESLRAYLDRPEPFIACMVCAGRDTAVKIPWREERDVATWLNKSAGKDGVTR